MKADMDALLKRREKRTLACGVSSTHARELVFDLFFGALRSIVMASTDRVFVLHATHVLSVSVHFAVLGT